MRVLVCGDREWVDQQMIYNQLKQLHTASPIEIVIEGEARGADLMGRKAATYLNIPVLGYAANWKEYGRSAGPIRNQQMLKEGRPDLVLAFHDHLDQSKGTRHMVSIAQKAGIPVQVISHGGELCKAEAQE